MSGTTCLEVLAGTGRGTVPAVPGDVTKVALHLPEGLSFEEWESCGVQLRRMAEGVMWWVGDWWRYGERRYGERASQALDSESFALQTFMNAAWVAGRIGTSRRREVLSFSHHAEVASLEPEQQDELLNAAVENGWSRNELRAEMRRRRAQRLRSETADLSHNGDRFSVILADPPWRYDFSDLSRAVDNQYPTMELAAIEALPVPAADDAVLFLWATSPKLGEAMTVIEAWGFEYRTCMVWVKGNAVTGKDHIGMGYYVRQQHELLLVAKRGTLVHPAPENRPPSVVVAPRMEHSAKPERFHELIDAMYPGFRKLEMFARSSRANWVSWGAEVAA